MKEKELFQELSTLVTEQRNPESVDIDIMDTENIVRLINKEDKSVANIVENEIPYIVEAIEFITKALLPVVMEHCKKQWRGLKILRKMAEKQSEK